MRLQSANVAPASHDASSAHAVCTGANAVPTQGSVFSGAWNTHPGGFATGRRHFTKLQRNPDNACCAWRDHGRIFLTRANHLSGSGIRQRRSHADSYLAAGLYDQPDAALIDGLNHILIGYPIIVIWTADGVRLFGDQASATDQLTADHDGAGRGLDHEANQVVRGHSLLAGQCRLHTKGELKGDADACTAYSASTTYSTGTAFAARVTTGTAFAGVAAVIATAERERAAQHEGQ